MSFWLHFRNLLMGEKAWPKILAAFFAFLLFTQAVGAVSFYLNRERLENFDPWQPAHSNFTVPFYARWDSGWYVSIVKENYVLKEGQNSNVTFLPMYPALIKLVSYILPFDYFYLGQIIAWAALFFALLFFYKLLLLDYGSGQAVWILTVFLIFPWSFFLGAVYTEGLFLFLITASFYLARKRLWVGAGILGFFAALTRITGIFLLPALLYEYYVQNRRLEPKALWLLSIPAGFCLFIAYLKIRTGGFFSFIYNQTTYSRRLSFPLLSLWEDLKHTVGFALNGNWLKAGVYAITLLSLFVFAFILVRQRKQIRGSYMVFAVLSVLLPLFSGTTISLGRYLLVIFPFFIAVGLIKHKIFKSVWLTINFLLLMVMAYAFVGWYFIV